MIGNTQKEKAMKKFFCVLVSVMFLLTACQDDEPVSKIPSIPMDKMDDNFKAYLMQNFDLNKDGIISEREAAEVKKMNCSGMRIINLEGIQYFPNLEELDCSGNYLYLSIDVSRNPKLKKLNCSNSGIIELDVSKNLSLETLICASDYWLGRLQSIQINPALKQLRIINHGMSLLDFSGHQSLKELYCWGNELVSLDVSRSVLEKLFCQPNQVISINANGCTSLKWIFGNGNIELIDCASLEELFLGGLTSLDVSHSPLLKTLHIYGSTLVDLDLSNNAALEELYLGDVSIINDLDLSNRKSLKSFTLSHSIYYIASNYPQIINLSECTSLENVNIKNSTSKGVIEHLNLSGCTALSTLTCTNYSFTELNLNGCSNLSFLDCGQNQLSKLDLSDCPDLLTLNCSSNRLQPSLDLSMCTTLSEVHCTDNPNLAELILYRNHSIKTLNKDSHTQLVLAN